jgi:hypothetical protein
VIDGVVRDARGAVPGSAVHATVAPMSPAL